MSNTFNMQRFLMLFKKHTKEHYKTHLMSLGVLTGVLIITLGYIGYVGGMNGNSKEGVFTFFFALSGCVFNSMIFSDLNQKNKALTILTLPVSSLERFLVGWIYSFIIFQIMFVACFFVIDAVVVSITNNYVSMYKKQELVDFSDDDSVVYYIFLYSWFLHGAAFLGSIFFKNLHFVKTVLAVFGFLFMLLLINQVLVRLIIDLNVSAKIPFYTLEIRDGTSFHYLQASASMPGIVGFMFLTGTLCLWAATYFRLKEKQI